MLAAAGAEAARLSVDAKIREDSDLSEVPVYCVIYSFSFSCKRMGSFFVVEWSRKRITVLLRLGRRETCCLLERTSCGGFSDDLLGF